MKQYITLICAIAIILFGGFGEIKYLEESSKRFLSEFSYIEDNILSNNYKEAKKQFKSSYDSWEDVKNTWNIFVNHEEIDDIDQAILDLKGSIKYEEEEECVAALEKIKSNIEHTVRRQQLHIDNIL